MKYQFLDNGVEVAIRESHFSKMAAVQVWVHAGSQHEDPSQRGMAHLIEHMLFKGTEKREVGEISSTVERLGGDMNAYTTFDRTVYYMTLPSEHVETAIDLLADAVFNSAFDSVELDREKEVVVEEIRRGNDSPANIIGKRLFALSYPECEIGRPIIGYEEEVKEFSREELLRYYRQWYVPNNMSVVVCGAVDSDQTLAHIKTHFGSADALVDIKKPVLNDRFPDGLSCEVIKGDYEQPRIEIAFKSPPMSHSDIVPLDLAAFALGSGDSSRLSRRLRDERGIVSAAGSSVYTPQVRGVFFVSAFPRMDTLIETTKELGQEIAAMKYVNPVTQEELTRAQINMRADRLHQEETVGGMARGLGFSLTTDQKLYFDDVYMEMVNKTKPAHVRSAVERWLQEQNAVILALVPESSDLTAEQLKNAYLEGIRSGKELQTDKAEAAQSAVSDSEKGLPEWLPLKDGVHLAYRQNNQSGLFSLSMATEGGLRGESDQNAGIYNAFSGLLGKATKTKDYDTFLSSVEGRGATIEGFSGKDSFGMRLQCLAEDTDEMLGSLFDSFFNPVFPQQQWETVKREIAHSITAQNDSPSSICFRRFQKELYAEHPYHHPVYGTEESVATFNPESLCEFFMARRDGGPWVISAVGPDTSEEFMKKIMPHLEGWNPHAAARTFTESESQIKLPETTRVHVHKDREQAHLCIGYPGLTWSDQDRPVLDVLSSILGGHGGRLFSRLREELSLAYTVAPVMGFGQHPGAAAAYIACAPSKVDLAISEMENELQKCCQNPPTDDELTRAKNYIVGNHEVDLQRGDSQAMTMALMGAYGVGHDDFLKYPERIKAVTADDVKRVATRLFQEANKITVVVGPEAKE